MLLLWMKTLPTQQQQKSFQEEGVYAVYWLGTSLHGSSVFLEFDFALFPPTK